MRKTILFFLILTVITTSHAQISSFLIKGKIDAGLAHLILNRSTNNVIVSIQDTIKIEADKTFNQKIKINKPTKATLVCGDRYYQLWLTPGSSLTIDLKDGNAMFSGNAGIFAKYYIEDQAFWSKTFEDYKKKYPNFDQGANSYSDNYFLIQDSITNQRLNFLKKYFIDVSTNGKQGFVQEESLSFIYSNLYYKTTFSGSKAEKFKFYQDRKKINSSNFYAFSDSVQFNDSELLSNDYYRQFIISFINNLVVQNQNENGQKFVFNSFLDSVMTTIDVFFEENKVAEEMKICFINYIVEQMERNKDIEWAGKIDTTLSSIKS